MGIFGVDVSNHQTSFDFTGWDFAILKASEGSGFKDRMFPTHLANARRVGAVVAAYHYVRTDPADYQVGNIEAMVPKDVPVILDVEDGAGADPNLWRQLITELRERGYSVPLIYLPRWYWNKIGQPDLSGFPPLWQSWYPDYVARPREVGISMVPASAWAPMDGIPVAIMQFTSSPFDQNYYGGTKEQLLSLLGGNEDEVGWSDPLGVSEQDRANYGTPGPAATFDAGTWLKCASLYAGEAMSEARAANAKAQSLEQRIDEVKEQNRLILVELSKLASGGGEHGGVVDIDAVADKVKDKIVEDLDD